MLWTIFVILLGLWFLAYLGGVGGSLAYLMIVIGALVLIFNLLGGRRSAV